MITRDEILLANLEQIHSVEDAAGYLAHVNQHHHDLGHQARNLVPFGNTASLKNKNRFHRPEEDLTHVIAFWHEQCQPAAPALCSRIQTVRSEKATITQKLEQRVSDKEMYSRYKSECVEHSRRAVSKTTFVANRYTPSPL
jgi:predicted nucleic acid-binding Zn ribbon protein